jgi:hypothetical protein
MIKNSLTSEQRYLKSIRELPDIQEAEYRKAGMIDKYDPLKTVYENLFQCDFEGCIFRNIYYHELLIHKEAGSHYFKKGG